MEWLSALDLRIQTALISTGVAVVVTLMVEYAAKPRLEARKDRILDRHRAVRDLRTAFGRLGFYIGQAEAYAEHPESFVPERLSPIREGIEQEAATALAALTRPDLPIPQWVQDGAGGVVARLTALLVHADRSSLELDSGYDGLVEAQVAWLTALARQVAEPYDDACDALTIKRWRLLERSRLRRRLADHKPSE